MIIYCVNILSVIVAWLVRLFGMVCLAAIDSFGIELILLVVYGLKCFIIFEVFGMWSGMYLVRSWTGPSLGPIAHCGCLFFLSIPPSCSLYFSMACPPGVNRYINK